MEIAKKGCSNKSKCIINPPEIGNELNTLKKETVKKYLKYRYINIEGKRMRKKKSFPPKY